MTETKADLSTVARSKQPWWRRLDMASALFVLIGLIFGGTFIAINPPYWGNDGMSQYARAYQVSQGYLLPVPINWGNGKSFGGEIPSTAWDLYVHAGNDLGQNPPEPGPMILDPARYAALTAAPYSVPTRNTVWFTNTAAYSPVPYLPSVVGSRLGEALNLSLGTTLNLMAIANLLSYLGLVTLALFAVRAYRIRWVIFSAALFTPALLQVSTITADALTNALAILFFTLFAKAVLLRGTLQRWETALLLTAVVLLPLCKPTYVFLSALVAAIPVARLGARERTGRWAKWIALGVAVVAWVAWTFASKDTADVLAFYRSDYATSSFGTAAQVSYALGHPLEVLKAAARTLFYRENFYFLNLIGSSGIQVPDSATALSWAGIVLASGLSERLRATRLQAVTFYAVVAVSLAAIFGTLFLTFTPVGYYLIDGVQGRYFFPLLPYFLGALLLAVGLRFGASARQLRGADLAVVVLTVLSIAMTVVKFYFVVWG